MSARALGRRVDLEERLFDEVLAGAEGFGAGAGDYGDAQGGFGVEPEEEVVHFPVGGCGDAVHGFGAVDGDEDDAGSWVGEEVGGGCGDGGLGLEFVRHDGLDSRDVLETGVWGYDDVIFRVEASSRLQSIAK